MATTEKVGVIGSGQVARVLAEGFVRHGYKVCIGSRDIGKLSAWRDEAKVAVETGSFEEAAAFGEIVVLAVKGTVALEVVKKIAHALQNKVVIDTTNPIADAPPVNGVLKYFTDLDTSLMEQLQAAVPAARFVKCFSCVGNAQMVNPDFREKPGMFICGNDAGAREDVSAILDTFGWKTVDMGGVEAARAIEPLAILWCIPGFLRNEWRHVITLVNA